MASKRIQEEKQHHKEAFEVYFMLPPDKRSIREVARTLKKAPSTVQSWAESFNWQERVQVREAHVKKQFKELQKQNDDTLIEIKASFHKILKALIAEAIKDITNKHLKIEDVGDLLKVMKLDLELLGEDERKAANQLNELTEAVKASMNLFGGNAAQWVYDGNDRIEGENNDDDGEEEDE